jgi:hypothetical protein
MDAEGVVPPWFAHNEATKMDIHVEGEWVVIFVRLRDEDAICELRSNWVGLGNGWALRGWWRFKAVMETRSYFDERFQSPSYNEDAYPRRQWEFRGRNWTGTH